MKKINKIFQIGFNKCGTVSICEFFKKNGLRCCHWEDGVLADTINSNYITNQPLLKGYETYDVFTDMENVSKNIFIYLTHYKELDKQYPNSKFILNIRPIDNWIKSRINHIEPPYLNEFKQITKLDEAGVIELWKHQWNEHIKSVTEYFKDRPDDLLIFDIETEAHKLSEFMSPYIEIKTKNFPKINETKTITYK
jgi:hypothetical protein